MENHWIYRISGKASIFESAQNPEAASICEPPSSNKKDFINDAVSFCSITWINEAASTFKKVYEVASIKKNLF